jgi:hypothetical protein
MKYLTNLFLIPLLIFLWTSAYAQNDQGKNIPYKECCVKSLLQGLKSDNEGLQAGCAYMLGEVCCKESVVELMNVFHNNPSEEIRILAALSLIKIGDSRGIFAIKQGSKFDKSERVRNMCEKFYRASLKEDDSNDLNLTYK